MFNTIFEKGSLPAIEQWFYFTAHRHAVIANNIANVETPFYKTMATPDAEFRKMMFRAWDEQKLSPVNTWELHRRDGIVPRKGAAPDVRYREAPLEEAGILRHSENNVDIDLEVAKMVKNSGLHTMLSTLLTQQFELMREAISERVR